MTDIDYEKVLKRLHAAHNVRAYGDPDASTLYRDAYELVEAQQLQITELLTVQKSLQAMIRNSVASFEDYEEKLAGLLEELNNVRNAS